MLSWTAAGAVERPRTLQIRVQRSYPGRIRAGAPVPTRAMSVEEIRANLRYFTEGMTGPRTQPCTGLVLSGVGVAARDDIPPLVVEARAWGIEEVVLHVGVEDLQRFDAEGWRNHADVLVVPIQPGTVGGQLESAVQAMRNAKREGFRLYANTVLNDRALDRLKVIGRLLIAANPDGVTFTYPFPVDGGTSGTAPPPGRTLAALSPVFAALEAAGIEPRIKGLPACYLGALAGRLARTGNRWYVDADHQKNEALMFFPQVVSFAKDEGCRFCAADERCDGFFATYLRREGYPPLEPVL